MWIFGQTINKVTIAYVVIAMATSGLLAPIITSTGTRSEAFFIILATLDLLYRSFKLARRKLYKLHGPIIKESLLNKIKKTISPFFHPFEGAHVLFIPSWLLSFAFIYIIKKSTNLILY